jgi:hypothetical protein
MLSAIMLNVIGLNVSMPSVIMLNVAAPTQQEKVGVFALKIIKIVS